MANYFSPICCLLLGGLFLIRNVGHLMDATQLRYYLQRSPNAKRWVNYFGFDRTFHLLQKLILPCGCAISFILVVLGCWQLLLLSSL